MMNNWIVPEDTVALYFFVSDVYNFITLYLIFKVER